MAPELRRLPTDADLGEIREWWRAHSQGFGSLPDWKALDDELTVCPSQRMIGVWEGNRCLATTASYAFELSLPGGATVPTIGVANVTVSGTHRRQGWLSRMLDELHRDARDRGDQVAVLTASESHIYGRFGYGLATSFVEWEIECDRAGLLAPIEVPGRFEVISRDSAGPALREVYEAVRRTRPGFLSRDEAWWRLMLSERPSWKGGGRLFVVVHRDDRGRPDGFATYKVHHGSERWVNRWQVEVTELLATTPDVEAGLWQFVFETDLVTGARARLQPVDASIRWRLAEPRQLMVSGPIDLLWLRLLDVPGVLSARRYADAGALVLEVVGNRDGRAERLLLDAGPDGATCHVTGRPTDVRLPLDSLGALVLGGVSFSTLAAAGRCDEVRVGSLTRADDLFRTARAPFCSTLF